MYLFCVFEGENLEAYCFQDTWYQSLSLEMGGCSNPVKLK